jgi:branched-chain amino acid transport system permease protein
MSKIALSTVPSSGVSHAPLGMKSAALVVVAGILALLPLAMGDFYVNLTSQILIAAVFAMSLNLLVGYGGLSSLGHASFLGSAAYLSAWFSTRMGLDHGSAALLALGGTTVLAAFFGFIALRASGLGFLMITLALSQVLWGLAYRWVSVTNGDNGLSGLTRPMPFGLSIEGPAAFYWFVLVVTVIAFVLMAVFVSSSFGSSLKGTRDQPRRMAALGYNTWMIRWIAFIYAGFWGGVAGLLYVYYHKYIHPTSLSITSSAEGLLSVIAGGSGTLGGPVVGATLVMLLKNYASAYVERWNMLLGFTFLVIVLVMPEGIVPGVQRLLSRLRRGAR